MKTGLTKAELAAIESMGRQRKTKAHFGKSQPISTHIFNQLRRKALVMVINEQKQDL